MAKRTELSTTIESIASVPSYLLATFRGGACTVTGTNQYSGYGPVVTTRGRRVSVLGVPRWYRSVPTGMPLDGVSERSETNGVLAEIVRDLLRLPDVMQWGNWLAGNYLMVVEDPRVQTCWIITDLGNSYHCYRGGARDGTVCFGTHVDAVARTLGRSDDIDLVSIVEYLTQMSVSYPHTFYAGITEVAYASVTRCEYRADVRTTTTQYWLPTCRKDEVVDDVRALAPRLRDGLVRAATAAFNGKRNVGFLLSGGMDSRVLAGIAAEYGVRGTAITVVDTMNYESAIASRVATACGLTHEIWERDVEYFPRLCDAYLESEGPHATFTRGLHFGFRERILGKHFDALIGGYMSDTLLKLHEANVVPRTLFGRDLGPLEAFDRSNLADLRGGDRWRKQFAPLFRSSLLDAAAQRRRRVMEEWEALRQDGSAWEWSWMWPFTRNKHNNNLTTHIFHYPSFELLCDREVIECARIASQRIKLNGRLFNAAMHPFLRRTARIPLAVTGLPILYPHTLRTMAIVLKHLPPRRWMFRHALTPVPVTHPTALHRSFPDFEKLWGMSRILQAYRATYDPQGIESLVMQPSPFGVFDVRRYGALPPAAIRHCMYTMLHFDRWKHARQRTLTREPSHHVQGTGSNCYAS